MGRPFDPWIIMIVLITLSFFIVPIILGRIMEEPEEKQQRKQKRLNWGVKKEEFADRLITEIRSAGRDAEINRADNFIIIDKAIGIIPPSDIGSLYDSFKQGYSVKELADKLLDLVVFKKKQIGKYTNFETEYFLRDKQLTLRVMNIGRHREELRNLVYTNVEDDIALCIACRLEDEDGSVHEQLMDRKTFRPWMWRQAYSYSPDLDPPKLYCLSKDDDDEDDYTGNLLDARRLYSFKKYFLTNEKEYLGASVLFQNGIQDRIYDLLGECYMIPLSVDGWVIVPVTPYSKQKYGKYERMLREDNQNAKNPDEVLSDNVYVCCAGYLVLASEEY